MKKERISGFSYGKSGFGIRLSGSREMRKATCTDCSRETEIPFQSYNQSYNNRPIYCRECYQNHIPKRY